MQSLRSCQVPRLQARLRPTRRALTVVNATAFEVLEVRPYTLRKGDTLESIAKKRSMTVDQLLSVNPGVKVESAGEGVTILLPNNKLSARDKEIIDGMGATYRLYPVRAGETVTEIMSKRNITLEELQSLNPGVDVKSVKDNQVLKLPINKFTVREREMLIGARILPPEFFTAAKNPFVVGGAMLMLVCGFVMAWQRFHNDPDMQAAE